MTATYLIDSDLVGLFLLALFVSTVLAYGFQFILSLLSVATGMSFIPNFKQQSAKNQAKKHHPEKEMESSFESGSMEDGERAPDESHGVVITSGLGLWSLVTSSIALFAATWLGISLAPTTPQTGIIAGLVVWAIFFIGLSYLEYKTVHTIVGGMINSAIAGLRFSAQSASQLFSSSQSQQQEKIARNTVDAIYDEVTQIVKKNHIDRDLGKFLADLKPDIPDTKQLRHEIEKILEEIEIEEHYLADEDEIARVLEVHIGDNPAISKHHARELRNTVQEAVSAYKSREGKTNKTLAVASRILPISEEDAHKYEARLEEILRSTGKKELDPEEFKHDLELLFKDPAAGTEDILSRLKHFDRDTLKKVISSQAHIDEEKADKILVLATRTLDMLEKRTASLLPRAKQAQDNAMDLPGKFRERLASALQNIELPDIDYGNIKRQVQAMLADPSIAPHVLKMKLAELNKDSITDILLANPRISEQQAEKIADSIITARDQALETAQQVQDEAIRRYANARRRAVLTAEHARHNAIAASWWLVMGAAVSAVAAALGGYLGSSF